MPEGLSESLPYIFKLLKSLNIQVLSKDGYEADDIIGTIAKSEEKKGFQVYMMTSDKDFAQLVSDNIFMYGDSQLNGKQLLFWVFRSA